MRHLSETEYMDRANALARACGDVRTVESKHANMKAQMKSELTDVETERDRLGDVVRAKAELRDVMVSCLADDRQGLALYIRADTGEEIRRRPLTDQERQAELPLKPAAAPKTKN